MIVEKLGKELSGHIGKGQVTGLKWNEAKNRINVVEVNMGDRTAIFKPGFVILAAGKDNQPLLRGITAEDERKPFEDKLKDVHLVRNVPMVLVRGKGLPNASGMFLDANLSVFSHPSDKGELMWVVTPLGGHSTTKVDVDSLAEPKIESPLVKDGLTRLTQIFPSAGKLLEEKVYFSTYFGAKVDHPEGAMKWFVAGTGISNLRCVWPGLWSLSRPAALEVIAELEKTLDWQRMVIAKRTLDVKAKTLASNVGVGTEQRLAGIQKWLSPHEFKAALKI